ncbi:hypothetical protein WOLCODRAFT_137666 [Wolfiporia cocos MD-104 SS10]|uniref:COQ9 C-terminal domain-containing protein n=1 Tax=Wolfiporia cocos (strain MD-104) TaxID=742152 RepID=A0A2H3JW43_WOLCO|nr:hypothetical protein WOLCODRAFT_137666 [Wolfiporia cocos MD-104 SS10]
MSSSRAKLLQLALPLVRTHGFTRQALSSAALSLPGHSAEPLSETAVSALFGEGDDARRALFQAWLEDARAQMRQASLPVLQEVLSHRLRLNEPVLGHLPEAFALLVSPAPGLPPLDPTPALRHAASIADESCHIIGDTSVGPSWYARRASIASVYAAAELHQLTSPKTAFDFLDGLLDTASKAESLFNDAGIFAGYIGRSWAGIIRSRGLF